MLERRGVKGRGKGAGTCVEQGGSDGEASRARRVVDGRWGHRGGREREGRGETSRGGRGEEGGGGREEGYGRMNEGVGRGN